VPFQVISMPMVEGSAALLGVTMVVCTIGF
jgi:hypothetical protein